MTDRATHSVESAQAPAQPSKAARRRRPGPGAVIWGSVAAFAVLFGFLTAQLRGGNDPAIGATGATTGKAGKVLVRRVIHRRVVTTVIPASSGGAGGTSVSSSSAPTVTASAPAAPAAPVTTSAS